MNKKVMAIVAVIALVAILGVCLVACNADSVEKKLEKAGYTILAKSTDVSDKVEWTVSAAKGTDSVLVTKYKNSDDAKAAESKANTTVLGVKAFESVKRVGNVVYTGTEQGVKDAM